MGARTGVAVAAGICLMVSAGAAHASVTVLGGGLAHDCSLAALGGAADDKALALCTTAIEVEPLYGRDLAGTLVNRGVIQLRRKAWTEAKDDFDRAVRNDPRLGEAYVNRGAALLAERRFEEGVADIDKGIALGPQEPEKAWFNRALAHERMGDLQAAYGDYSKAAALAPDWAAPKQELARFITRPR